MKEERVKDRDFLLHDTYASNGNTPTPRESGSERFDDDALQLADLSNPLTDATTGIYSMKLIKVRHKLVDK
jgi:hypothetical protein